MFESKIEDIIKNNDLDHKFLLEEIRSSQICEVIDSLTEEEFLGLQESALEVFPSVDHLLATVKKGLNEEESYDSIYQAILRFLEKKKKAWLEKEKRNNPWANAKKKFYYLLERQFSSEVEEPIQQFRIALQESLCSRELAKNRILSEENQSEIGRIKTFYHLAQDVKENLKQEEVLSLIDSNKLERLSAEEIYQGLILQMIDWKDSTIYAGKHEFNDYFFIKRNHQQEIIDSQVNLFMGKLEEIHQLQSNLSKCSLEKKRKVKKKEEKSIRSRLVSLIKGSKKDQTFNRFILGFRHRTLLRFGWVPNHLEVMKELLSAMESSFNIQCARAKNMLFNTSVEDSHFVSNFLEKEGQNEDYLISKSDFEQIKRHIDDIDVIERYKELAHDRKLVFHFYKDYFSLSEETCQELKKLFQSGEMDQITLKIREKVSEIFDDSSTDLELSKVQLYEQVMSARKVKEEEIINVLVKKM